MAESSIILWLLVCYASPTWTPTISLVFLSIASLIHRWLPLLYTNDQASSHSRINLSFGFAETFICWGRWAYLSLTYFWHRAKFQKLEQRSSIPAKGILSSNSLLISSRKSWAITFKVNFSTNCLWQFWHWYLGFLLWILPFLTVWWECLRGQANRSDWHERCNSQNSTDFLLDRSTILPLRLRFKSFIDKNALSVKFSNNQNQVDKQKNFRLVTINFHYIFTTTPDFKEIEHYWFPIKNRVRKSLETIEDFRERVDTSVRLSS